MISPTMTFGFVILFFLNLAAAKYLPRPWEYQYGSDGELEEKRKKEIVKAQKEYLHHGLTIMAQNLEKRNPGLNGQISSREVYQWLMANRNQ